MSHHSLNHRCPTCLVAPGDKCHDRRHERWDKPKAKARTGSHPMRREDFYSNPSKPWYEQ